MPLSEKSSPSAASQEDHDGTADGIAFHQTGSESSVAFSEESTHRLLSNALGPLFWASMAGLFFTIADAIFFFPASHSWLRVTCELSLIGLIIVFRRITRSPQTPIEYANKLRLVPVFSAIALACAFHLWNPSLEVARALIIMPLIAAAQFRTVRACVVSNILFAIIWAFVWHKSGLPFTHTALLYHLVLVPIFSFAIFSSHDLAIRQMLSLQHIQQQHYQEQHDAMRLVVKESSKRAKVEAELRQANQSINEFLQRIPVACFRRTKEKILFMSSAYERIWDRPVEKLYKDPAAFSESVHPEDQSRIAEAYAEYLNGNGCECEYRIIRPDGTIRWIRSETHVVHNEESGADYDIGVAHDITIRKEAEERFKQQESLLLHSSRLSSTGELVAGIAHEVNQPLYSIVNYAQAIENTIENTVTPDLASIRTLVRKIRDEATRGGKITHRLKSFVKRSDAQHEMTDLRKIIRESIDFIAMEARHAVVEVVSDLDDDLPAVFVDRIQIQQVLVNLIKNAIEAFDEHGSEPSRVVITANSSKGGVEVSVADNGVGLPEGIDANILEPFQTTKAEGIGLGLAISNTIIESHRSELTYEPNSWGGATFRFTLANNNCMERV